MLAGRYKMFPQEAKALLRGEYGRLPGEVNEEVRRMAIGDAPVITHRPADDLPPEMDKLRAELKGVAKSEEDVLSYALFPKVALKFFEERDGKKAAPAPVPPARPAAPAGPRVLVVEDLGA